MQDIPLIPVTSSQIEAIGHDSGTNTLAVQFKSKSGPGSIYHYSGVEPKTFEDMFCAESIGKFFGENVKGRYDFAKVPQQEVA